MYILIIKMNNKFSFIKLLIITQVYLELDYFNTAIVESFLQKLYIYLSFIFICNTFLKADL